METIQQIASLRNAVRTLRAAGKTLALVPTMGNLHEGHIDLVRAAREQADVVAVSIFVNPMQFGANEDLDSYPRTPEADAQKLVAAGVSMLFLPGVEEIYPVPLEEQTGVEVPGLSDLYCGASRPGHFRGVATVVCKLLNIVQPDSAFFGEKDYQQLAIIRRMASDLCLPVEIHGVPIRREADGLAMSSRNGYLSAEQRALAPRLYRELQQLAAAVSTREQAFPALIAATRERLEQNGFKPDYVAVCRQADLQPAGTRDKNLVILAAAWLGKTRLIDNVTLP